MTYHWIRTHGSVIPRNAFIGGYDGTLELFVARARNPEDGRLTGGKAAYALPGCHISYGGKEIIVTEYEVLTIKPENRHHLTWEVSADGRLPERAVCTDSKSKLYVARIAYNNTLTPGKFQYGFQIAHVGYGGEEKFSNRYEVLCYKPPPKPKQTSKGDTDVMQGPNISKRKK